MVEAAAVLQEQQQQQQQQQHTGKAISGREYQIKTFNSGIGRDGYSSGTERKPQKIARRKRQQQSAAVRGVSVQCQLRSPKLTISSFLLPFWNFVLKSPKDLFSVFSLSIN